MEAQAGNSEASTARLPHRLAPAADSLRVGLSPPFPHRCLLLDDEKLTDILGLFFGFVKCLFFSWTGRRIATGAARPRNDRGFVRGTVERADRGVRPYKNADDLARVGGVDLRPYAAYGDRIS